MFGPEVTGGGLKIWKPSHRIAVESVMLPLPAGLSAQSRARHQHGNRDDTEQGAQGSLLVELCPPSGLGRGPCLEIGSPQRGSQLEPG